jgi:hypothetical protein
MSKEVENYNVELRVHFERDGEDDYTEDDYQFDTREEAMKFANKYAGEVHDVLEYYKEGGNRSIW